MTLVTGSWKFFTDNKVADLHIDNLTNSGSFSVGIAKWLTGLPVLSIQGEGLWNDVSQQITMIVSHEFAEQNAGLCFVFTGHQIEGLATGDPAGDVLWTLAGTYQAIPFKIGLTGLEANMGILVQTSRRQTLGWFAQTTEIK